MMIRPPVLARVLLITLFAGLVIASVGALTTASALGGVQTDVRTDISGGGGPTVDPGATVEPLTEKTSDLLKETTGVDPGLGGVTDEATRLLYGNVPSPGPSEGDRSSAVEARSMTPQDKATAGALAAASGAGVLLWLHSVLGGGLGRLFMIPLFSRIEKDELLDNDARDLLLTLVDQNPGIGLKQISEQAGLGWGTTVYHMSRLEAAGFVASIKNGQGRHFFKNGHPAALMKKHVAVLRNETAGNLARFLLATPGSTQSTIAKRLGLGAPTVTKYVKRMESQGLVEVIQDGRSKIVQPTGALQSALDHAAPVPTATPGPPVMPERTAAVGVA